MLAMFMPPSTEILTGVDAGPDGHVYLKLTVGTIYPVLDFHQLTSAHAGRTQKAARAKYSCSLSLHLVCLRGEAKLLLE